MLSLVLALAIALSPFRQSFVESDLHEVLHFVGSASVPLVLVQLGAGAAQPPAMETQGLQVRSAATIVFLRLIVANVVGSGIVTTFRWLGWVPSRHVALCLYLQCCAPTAANVMLVSGVQRAYVQPTATVLFFMQLAAIPTMVISVAVYVAMLS